MPRIALPPVDSLQRCFAPIEGFVVGVQAGPINENDDVLRDGFDEAIVHPAIDELPERVPESEDIQEDDGYKEFSFVCAISMVIKNVGLTFVVDSELRPGRYL
jgi:hypothetical protein